MKQLHFESFEAKFIQWKLTSKQVDQLPDDPPLRQVLKILQAENAFEFGNSKILEKKFEVCRILAGHFEILVGDKIQHDW